MTQNPPVGVLNVPVSAFRNWLTADGAAGPSGEGGFCRGKGSLSFVCFSRLPVGASHVNYAVN